MTNSEATVISRSTRKPRRWLRRLVIAALLFIGVIWLLSRTASLPIPVGIQTEERQLSLAGQSISVTLFFPVGRSAAPLVVVAHGFLRGKRYMEGWGSALAAEGFVVAVPTQPALADHALNARVLAELVGLLRSGKISLQVKAGPRAALMGFSMGGLTTFLAAAKQPVDAWVGLDPVGMNNSWLTLAKKVRMPCAILRAEPGAWNKDGNARSLTAALSGPKFTMKVRGGTHLDCESPTDLLGQLACGRADAQRHAIFERYTISFLKAVLNDDASARQMIAAAVQDAALAEVEIVRLKPD